MAIPNDPNTREEHYLASMAGQKVDLPQPIPRIEKYLAKAAGMDVETPDPLTRVERYLDAIADGGGGGSSVTVEPLTVTQNGTTTAPSGKAYSPVMVDVPNPNYVETISGTLENPWGDYNLRTDLAPKLLSNEIDFYITFSVSNSVYVAFPNRGSLVAVTHICSAYSTSTTVARLSLLRYTPGGALQSATVIPEILESSGNWSGSGTSLDPTTPCTLTIIHHPLPDNE